MRMSWEDWWGWFESGGFVDQFAIHMGRAALRRTIRLFPQALHFPLSFTIWPSPVRTRRRMAVYADRMLIPSSCAIHSAQRRAPLCRSMQAITLSMSVMCGWMQIEHAYAKKNAPSIHELQTTMDRRPEFFRRGGGSSLWSNFPVGGGLVERRAPCSSPALRALPAGKLTY